ncbi:MAG: DNA starvation/stationary phase protection protein Dps [Anaerolineae bacterium]|nr:DNA starvation/stationary phase protection protein Dps [Anaerolineae bacterium]
MISVKEFATRNDIPHYTRETMSTLLNQQLADTFALYSQIKQAHWNVKGADFYQLHLLFDEVAASIFEYIDMLAERVTALGGYARGTVRMASSASRLAEFPTELTEGRQLVVVLAERMAQYGATTRAAIDTAAEAEDQSTADLFTQISRTVDKQLWFLEAHLQR